MKNSKNAESFEKAVQNRINATLGKILGSLLPSTQIPAIADYRKLLEVRPEQYPADSNWLAELIQKPKPQMVSRFGSTELRALLKLKNLRTHRVPQRLYKLLSNMETPVWSTWQFRNLRSQSGFFPLERESLSRFFDEMVWCMGEIDVLGSWVAGENQFSALLRTCHVVPRHELEPFFSPSPWTAALAGKRVVVIHPFAKTISSQFQSRRSQIRFKAGPLPEFDLTVVPSPQTLVAETAGFDSWFEALDDLEERVLSESFDIALIACGSYGMPLAARIKRAGHHSLHLGGFLQLMFGIRGRRWEELQEYRELFSDAWVYPAEDERPAGFQLVDKGVYW